MLVRVIVGLCLGALLTNHAWADDSEMATDKPENPPFTAMAPGAVYEDLTELRAAVTPDQQDILDAYITEQRIEMRNDPFIPPAEIDRLLAERLVGLNPETLLPEYTKPEQESSHYWEMREKMYESRLDMILEQQQAARDSLEKLDHVHVFNASLNLSGSPLVDKAELKFRVRNGTETPIATIRLKIFVHLPTSAPEPVIIRERNVRIEGKIQPWETRSIVYDIRTLLPEPFTISPNAQREQIYAEIRLVNYRPHQEGWAVTYIEKYQMKDLERTKDGLEQARVAQGENADGDKSTQAMMMN